MPYSSENEPRTTSDWSEWVDQRQIERRNVFCADPDELVSRYNQEKSSAQSYAGREILELIQNADDAGVDYEKPNKMMIRLTTNALYVANTGIPFSPAGVKALIVSDNSPKQLQRTRCIGYKGLGFRSVLGWSSDILISSGNLRLGFSRKRAVAWLQELTKADYRIASKVTEVTAKGLLNPIPTLSVPFVYDEHQLNPEIQNAISEIQNLGFETVICLIFSDPERALKEVQNQLGQVAQETLLFLQHLVALEIQTPEKSESWTLERGPDYVTFNPKSDRPVTWKILVEAGSIPVEFQRPEQPLLTQYEIKLASSRLGENQVNRIFVYFPTEAYFPFPFVAHVTFELADNRQHLIESPVNKWLAARLANLMAKVAEDLANPSDPWASLLSVAPTGNIDTVLLKLGFEDALREELARHKIIPVRNQKFESPLMAERLSKNFDDLLVSEEFSHVALFTDNSNILSLLDELGVQELGYEELRKRLIGIPKKIALPELAELIHRLVEGDLVRNANPPELLVDENNEVIPRDSKPILPPEGNPFALPKWVPIRLVNSSLAGKLKERFGVGGVRDLRISLFSFGVQEYNLSSVMSSIVAEANRRVREAPKQELALRQEMVQAIWNLYSIRDSSQSQAPNDVTVILPVRDGTFASSHLLYFGNEYPDGQLLEALYGQLGGPFVGGPATLGLTADVKDLERFLKWLGVSDLPRETVTDIYTGDFRKHVIEKLTYPLQFEDVIVRKGEIQALRPRISNVVTVDRLDKILAIADPHAIIAWLLRYRDKLDSWRTTGDSGASLKIRRSKQQNERRTELKVPSYPLWLLRTSNWIVLSDGTRRCPQRCILAKTLQREVTSFIGIPAIDLDHPLLKASAADQTSIRGVLTSVGVVTDVEELPWDSFYDILLELPARDPEGKMARSIYNALIARTDDEQPVGESRDKFLGAGKMWGTKQGNSAYHPIQTLFYLEKQTLPESAAKLLPILELKRRAGAAKVRRLFGIKSLGPSEVQIKLIEAQEHPCSSSFEADVESLKPYVFALRVEDDIDGSELRMMKKLSFKLCRSLKCSVRIEDEEKEISFSLGDSVVIDSSIVYILAEPSDYTKSFISDEVVAGSLGEVFSIISDVDIGSDVAWLASSSPTRRSALLGRMIGSNSLLRLEKSLEMFKEVGALTSISEEPLHFPLPPIPQTPSSGSSNLLISATGSASTTNVLSSSSVGKITVGEGKEMEVKPSHPIFRKVQSNVKPGNSMVPRGRRADPDRAESVAMAFESEQGRFPELVSHYRGSEAFGCDILSFRSEKEKTDFEIKLDMNLVERFIEVKGSSQEKGSIVLKDNELLCATKHRQKYFLFRVYEGDDQGSFELVETGDPLSLEGKSLKLQYEVNPFKTPKSVTYDVREVLQIEVEGATEQTSTG